MSQVLAAQAYGPEFESPKPMVEHISNLRIPMVRWAAETKASSGQLD